MIKREKSYWRNGKLVGGITILLILLSLILIGPLVWDLDLAYIGSSPQNVVPMWEKGDLLIGMKEATPDHPLGTESKGRDLLAVMLVAIPRTLIIGFSAAGIGLIIGIFLGFVSGYLRGWIDAIISTVTDVFMVIPGLLVLVVIASYVSQLEMKYMILIMSIFAWTIPARTIRAQVLTMRERGYIKTAELSGVPTMHIIFKEMMPNLLPYLAASFTATVSSIILTMSSLETLGLGPVRIPTLGMTINHALTASAVIRGIWWWWGLPIAALILIFIGLFLVSVGVDEIANPKLRKN